MVVDYILVGQGLAGSILAYELLKNGKKIAVFDQVEKNKSSQVAAGIFNPITGRRFVKTWQADHLFPFLGDFYTQIENDLDIKCMYPIPLFRPFANIEDQNTLVSKSTSDDLGPYIERIETATLENPIIRNEYGGVFLRHTGYVDIPNLIHSIKKFLIKQKSLIEERFIDSQLKIQKGGVIYGSIFAEKIIYCDGFEGINNRFFKWLPFQPVKGELIYIKMNVALDFIFNKAIFILPFKKNMYKVGATYDWNEINTDTTEIAKNYLEEKLKDILNVNFKTIEQFAGIRPATKDRRPFIGLHPEMKEIGIFNGLGSKGVSIAPYYANHFIKHLEDNTPLDTEVNIDRYISYYS